MLDNTEGCSRQNALVLGEFSNIAYLSEDKVKGAIEKQGMSLVKYLSHKETQVVIAKDNSSIIVSFRGTEPTKIKDWLTDFDVCLVAGPGGKVHEGFNVALNCVWKELLEVLREHRQKRELWVTGHSLGGALATLAVAKLRLERDEPVSGMCTFGQPRVGDRDFAARFDADFGSKIFRYVNNNDIIPRVPFRTMMYSHVGTCRYFDHAGVQHDNELVWWEKLLDRVEGRFEDLLSIGADGLLDHSIDKYIGHLLKNA